MLRQGSESKPEYGAIRQATMKMETVTSVSPTDVTLRHNDGGDADDKAQRRLSEINKHFEQFTENGVITKERFMAAIGDKSKSFLAERFFDSMDTDKNHTVDFEELNKGARRLLTGDMADRVGFIFSLYDFDGDGTITYEELFRVLEASTLDSSMDLSKEKLESLTANFVKEVDTDGDGLIDLKEMGQYLKTNPTLIISIAEESITWLMPPPIVTKKPKKEKQPLIFRIKNNASLVAFVTVMGIINVVVFIVNSYLYRESNWWIIIARGCGMCLDFDVSFVILLPLRRFITFLRMTELRKWLPIDHNLYLHMLFASLIVGFSIVHTIAHIGNAVAVAEDDYNVTVTEFIFTTKADLGWVAGLSPLTGAFLVIVLAVMATLSMPFIRRSGNFNVFYWSHKLYFVFYILCILHATHFWKWFVAPAVIFVIEQVQLYWFQTGVIEEVTLLPSNVMQLMIVPDQRFSFTAGDYVYVCVPAITKYEWHPFTISSTPKIKGQFTLHIRAVGSWTKRLQKYVKTQGTQFRNFVSVQASNGTSSTAVDPPHMLANARNRVKNAVKLTSDSIWITGPFGTPCREIFETSHPILIGAGIGVTPFASILQTLFVHLKRAAVTCPKCDNYWFHWGLSGKPIVDRVDFVWINRDSKSFEWFAELLFQLEQEFALLKMENVFRMHLFMTGARSIKELRGLGIQVALDINYKKTKTDCLTGLGTKTRAGRPNFQQLFKEISERSSYKKKVFMCGSPMLAKDVKSHCDQIGFEFSKENF